MTTKVPPESQMFILIHPPVVKPCEPPAGPAKLAGVLLGHGIPCEVIDANMEGMGTLLRERLKGEHAYQHHFSEDGITAIPQHLSNKWTSRSFHHLKDNLASLTSWETYKNIDRYRRAVIDINRVLEVESAPYGKVISLANYLDANLSPVASGDLIRAAERPESDPFYPYFAKRLSALLEREMPVIVGFSLNYLSQALCTFAMIGFLRRKHPTVRIILGGGLITSWMRRPGFSNPFGGLVDDLVAGPGEDFLLSIHGVAPDQGHHTPYYAGCTEGYLSPGPIMPYSTSSGCYWNRCSFCPERAEGNHYEPVPIDVAIEDMRILIDHKRPSLIHLLDNAVSPAMLRAIAESSLRIPWYGFARISRLLSELDFCLELRRSGCIMLQLGLESGDQDVLDSMGKGFDLATASLTLATLKRAGIAAYIYLIFGTPSETADSARKTLDFVVSHGSEIDFLNLAIFNLPVASPEEKGLEVCDFYEGDLSLYRNFFHPKGWNRALVRQFLDREFKRHPAVSTILKNSPPAFTSNHAPFFVINWR
ncbi:MAG TPA: B12-binding domain-containing radical SAM protein [Syntrophales bacterium]|nr:B12-binding domain-containing radical SAM protein [Syntrophales bacterium]